MGVLGAVSLSHFVSLVMFVFRFSLLLRLSFSPWERGGRRLGSPSNVTHGVTTVKPPFQSLGFEISDLVVQGGSSLWALV